MAHRLAYKINRFSLLNVSNSFFFYQSYIECQNVVFRITNVTMGVINQLKLK